MIRQYEIRQRNIEVSTQRPDQVSADAILLPWQASQLDEEPSGILGQAGEQVLEEIGDYKDAREVMLTSAGFLPSRFFFHLGMPEEGKASVDLLEERFRDCLFQSGVLGLSDLVIPINDFAPYAESFSELVGAIWIACREFLNRERGPQRILFLVEERDLSGQFLRHYFHRKEMEERGWESGEKKRRRPNPNQAAPPVKHEPRRLGNERVLSLDIVDEEAVSAQLAALLADYRNARPLEDARQLLEAPLRAAFLDGLAEGEELDLLPSHLRILGSDLVLRLPWELVTDEDGFLAERHLFTRGTNFLHFRTERRNADDKGFKVCFRVTGAPDQAKPIAEELRTLSERRKLGLNWSTEDRAHTRLLHCLGRSAADELLDEIPLSCELVFLELGDQDLARRDPFQAEEWARQLLAHGSRRVLVPMSPFRDPEERAAFRACFYDGLLSGDSAGESLQRAQTLLRERFGVDSGWWFYRFFGQTDEALIPGRRASSRKNHQNTLS